VLPHPTPGCDDIACCEQVCSVVPSCCSEEWDDFCAQLGDELCVGYCGAAASGTCFGPHLTPSCDTSACCDFVCLLDPFCCQESWDTNCAVIASLQCETTPGECGPGAVGDCFEPHANGACNDTQCCEAVCTISPQCCDVVWDFICVFVAEDACLVDCPLDCPQGGVFENELCGTFTNDPCVLPTPGAMAQLIECGKTICGRVLDDGAGGQPVDVDVYRVVLPDPDGDGLVQARVEFRSKFNGFAALLPAPCAPLENAVAVATSTLCVSGFIDLCVPPGEWLVVVAPGRFPAPGGESIGCGFQDSYLLTVDCLQQCGPVCNPNAGDCFVPHFDPGCAIVACCEAVCAELPSCCNSGWDVECAFAAVDLCDGAPPANDDCAECTPVGEGAFEFTTIGASNDGPGLPGSCNEGGGLSFDRDIWFCYTPTCNAIITAETCNAAAFDTRLAVYAGSCDAPQLVACNDDEPLCLQGMTSRVEFPATCGETYLIRVGGFDGAAGVGTLSIECGFGPPCPVLCPADLTGDSIVDGADLGLLLADWENPGAGDLDGDGVVTGADLGLLLASWGEC
jgi:hypothetical protein